MPMIEEQIGNSMLIIARDKELEKLIILNNESLSRLAAITGSWKAEEANWPKLDKVRLPSIQLVVNLPDTNEYQELVLLMLNYQT